ncbi:MAG TPA: pyridoxal phosphate-dependent aminotransferase [Euryarchaeota archaeon]|nr:pyridoxal phosphate-dependent aminotransferase [Euryarchaeota archaeon]
MNVGGFPLMEWVVKYEKTAKHNLGSSNVKGMQMDISWLSPFDMGKTSNKGEEEALEAVLSLYPAGLDAVTATGTSEANQLTIMALGQRGENTLVETPVYEPLCKLPVLMGSRVVHVPRAFENGWQFEEEALKEAAPACKLFVLTNSHNPSGIFLKEQQKKLLLDLSKDHKFKIVVDEIFRMLSPDIPSLAGEENVVVTSSLSKSLGLGGARCGWVVGEKRDIEKILAVKRICSAATNPLGERILARVLSQYPTNLDAINGVLAKRMAMVESLVKKSDRIVWTKPDHGCISFLKIQLPKSTLEFATELFKKDGVLVIPGEFFQCPGHIRVGVGVCDPKEGLNIISERLGTY